MGFEIDATKLLSPERFSNWSKLSPNQHQFQLLVKAHIASPRNIFIINVILYCLFLVLFAFVIRIDSDNKSRYEHQYVSIETLFKFQVLPPTLEMGTYFILLVPHTCFRRTPSGNHFQTFYIICNATFSVSV